MVHNSRAAVTANVSNRLSKVRPITKSNARTTKTISNPYSLVKPEIFGKEGKVFATNCKLIGPSDSIKAVDLPEAWELFVF